MQRRFSFDTPSVSVSQAGSPDGYGGLYAFHKYWGKKPHEPIAYAIQQLTQPHDIVVDPFLGSGASSREAISRRRRFVGFDVNPIAVAVSRLITSPPNAAALKSAFHLVEQSVKQKINATYALASGETATHFLWGGDTLQQVWIKGSAKSPRRELAPCDHDLSLVASFSKYCSRNIGSPRFFSNGRINASADMTLDNLLTARAQHNIDLLIDAIRESPAEAGNALKLCLTAASGQMTKMVFAVTGRGKTKGTHSSKIEVGSWVIGYWRPRLHFEVNVWNCFEIRVRKLISAIRSEDSVPAADFASQPQQVVANESNCFVGVMDCRKGLAQLPSECCALIITDPPHSDRVPYLELSAFWNAILGLEPCFEDEIVISNARERGKCEREYQSSMAAFLSEAGRILRDDGNLVLFFNAREADSWSAIREVILNPGQSGLTYSGKFPCNYSAKSVVQDNRRGALRHDWALVFSKAAGCGARHMVEVDGWSREPPELLATE